MKVRRRDPDDGHWRAFDHQRAADDGGASVEAPLPQSMTDHRDRAVAAAACRVVCRQQGPPNRCADAEDLKRVAAHPHRRDRLRLALDVHRRQRPREHAVEQPATADVLEGGVAEHLGAPVLRGSDGRECGELVRTIHRERPQKHAVDEREHRKRAPDAERKRGHGGTADDGRHDLLICCRILESHKMPPVALAPGTRLGPYEISAQIGVGGMGEVYRATDTQLKRGLMVVHWEGES